MCVPLLREQSVLFCLLCGKRKISEYRSILRSSTATARECRVQWARPWWLRVLELMWDFILIAASLAELALEVAVALQFLHTSKLWAGLIFGCLGGTNIVYTILVMQHIRKWKYNRALLFFLLLLVPWYLLPVGWYIFKRGWMSTHIHETESDLGLPPQRSSFGGVIRDRAPRVALVQAAAIDSTVFFLEYFEAGKRGMRKWGGGFLTQSFAESAPQAVIQLVALSLLPGPPTAVQYASICVALFNIASRLPVMVGAFHVGPQLFKLSVLCFDLFCSVYFFVSVFSRSQPAEVHLYGFPFSALAAICVVKYILIAGCIFILAIGMTVHQLVKRITMHQPLQPLVAARALLAFVVLFVPLTVAAECMKFSWIVLFFERVERYPQIRPIALLFAFLRQPRIVPDAPIEGEAPCGHLSLWKQRLSFLYFAALRHNASKTKSMRAVARPEDWCAVKGTRFRHMFTELLAPHAQLSQLYVPDKATRLKPMIIRSGNEQISCALHDAKVDCTMSVQMMYSHWRLIALNDRGSYMGVLEDLSLMRFWEAPTVVEGLIRFFVEWLLLLYVASCIFSVIFPALNFSLHYGSQSTIQHFCFYGSSASFIVAALFTPITLQYLLFLVEITFVFSNASCSDGVAMNFITQYYTPPPRNVIARCVPGDLVCRDIQGVVASFVPDDSLDFCALSHAECEMYCTAPP